MWPIQQHYYQDWCVTLAAISEIISDEDKAMYLLFGLVDEYNVFVASGALPWRNHLLHLSMNYDLHSFITKGCLRPRMEKLRRKQLILSS